MKVVRDHKATAISAPASLSIHPIGEVFDPDVEDLNGASTNDFGLEYLIESRTNLWFHIINGDAVVVDFREHVDQLKLHQH